MFFYTSRLVLAAGLLLFVFTPATGRKPHHPHIPEWPRPLRVLTAAIPGFLNVTMNPFTGYPFYSGFIPELLEMLSVFCNFKYSYVFSRGSDFGSELPDGSFNGLVGKLQRDEGDLLAAAMENHSSYMEAMDLLPPLFLSDVIILNNKKFNGPPPISALPENSTSIQSLPVLPLTVVLKNTATHDFMKTSNDPFIKSLYSDFLAAEKQLFPMPQNYTAAVNCVKDGQCKFIGRTPALDNEIYAARDKLAKDDTILRTVAASFGIRKPFYHSELKMKLDFAIRQMHKMGIIQNLFNKHFPQTKFRLT